MLRMRSGTFALLFVAMAMGSTGCGSKSSDRTPTGPPAIGAPDSGGRVSSFATAPTLGTADPFAVLGASTVTNTGTTVVNGDVGVFPGLAIVGFPPGIVNGTQHPGDATAMNAQNDVTTAYNALAAQTCNVVLTGLDLGGLTLTPGVYCFAASAQLTGQLTLDAQGNPGAVWVFQIGTTLTTASSSRVMYINGGQPCGTFWQVGSSATLGTSTRFRGNILALASITVNTSTIQSGGLFARTGAVTLDTNTVSRAGSCGGGPQPAPTPLPALPPVATGALLLMLLGVGAYGLSRR
jgi:hypothetical protein